MKKVIDIGLALLLLITMAGCIKISRKTSRETESYSVDAIPSPLTEPYDSGTPIRLVAGDRQKVQVTIKYIRGERLDARLKYNVQFSAPSELTVTPTSWDVEYDLMNYAGYNYTDLLSVDTAVDAAPGEREVKVTITPASGRASTSAVKFQVVKKGG
jgi:hypothetical protein